MAPLVSFDYLSFRRLIRATSSYSALDLSLGTHHSTAAQGLCMVISRVPKVETQKSVTELATKECRINFCVRPPYLRQAVRIYLSVKMSLQQATSIRSTFLTLSQSALAPHDRKVQPMTAQIPGANIFFFRRQYCGLASPKG